MLLSSVELVHSWRLIAKYVHIQGGTKILWKRLIINVLAFTFHKFTAFTFKSCMIKWKYKNTLKRDYWNMGEVVGM